MAKELLQDSVPFKLVLEESENGRLVAKGQFGAVDIPTANKRMYPRRIIERELSRLMKDAKERRLYGELDHPGDGKTKLSRSSHLITNLSLQEDGSVVGMAEILSTRNGKELQAIRNDGGQVGISSRGFGSVKTNNEGIDVVQDDFTLMTYDFVADPAAGGSYPEFSNANSEDSEMAKKKSDENKDAKEKEILTSEKKPDETKPKVDEAVISKEPEEKVEHEKEIATLKASFKKQLSEAIKDVTEKVRSEVRSELLSDPKVAGAMTAIESVKSTLRPYILEADVNKELEVRESRINDLTSQVDSILEEKKSLESKIEEFTSATKELGFKLFLERAVKGHQEYDSIIEKVGDVNSFASIEALGDRVNLIISEYDDVKEVVKDIKTESDGRVKALEGKVKTLEEQLSKSLEVSRNFGVQAYLRERVVNHPRAKEILSEAKFQKLESKENVDEFIASYRVVKRNVNEDYRSRIRRFVNKDSLVEDSIKGTRVVDRKQKIEETSVNEATNPLSGVPGVTLEDVERLSGVRK